MAFFGFLSLAAAGAAVGAAAGGLTAYFGQVEKAREASRALAERISAIGVAFEQMGRRISRSGSLDQLESLRQQLADRRTDLRSGLDNGRLNRDETMAELEVLDKTVEQIHGRMGVVRIVDIKRELADLDVFNGKLAESKERSDWRKAFGDGASVADRKNLLEARLGDVAAQLANATQELNAAAEKNDLATVRQLTARLKELASYEAELQQMDAGKEVEKRSPVIRLSAAPRPIVDAMQRLGATVGPPGNFAQQRTEVAQLDETKKGNRRLSDIHDLLRRRTANASGAWA